MINTLGTAFLWASFLVTTPHETIHLTNTQQEIWFSQQSAFEVKSLNHGIVFHSTQTGKFFSSGLNINNAKLTPILSLEREDFLALKKCQNLKNLKWESGHFLFPQLNPEIQSCQFKNIAFERFQNDTPLKDRLIQKEKLLAQNGIRIYQSFWLDQKRVLRIFGNNPRIQYKVRSILSTDHSLFDIEYLPTPSPGNTINFHVTLFEFSKRRAEQIGLQWPTNFQIQNINGRSTYTAPMGGDPNSFLVNGELALQKGVGKILAQPLLRAQPGVEAYFQSGGELPIKNHSSFHSETVWKNYGLTLKLKPEENLKPGSPELSVEFSLELSEPDASTAINGIPGILKRNLQSRFDLRTDETTLLSSLLNLKKGHNSNGVGLLSEIPILGLFFKSQNESDDNTELYIAIKASWEEISLEQYRRAQKHAYSN